MTSYRTALKDARGLGSARGGTGHFWLQRLTAVSNILVVAFLVYTAVHLTGAPRVDVKSYFSQPIAAIFGVLLAISISIHMRIGMQVIIEDYVHGFWKVPLLLMNTFFAVLVGAATVLAVIKLFLGA
ncbi:MAG: succinate dehydrogenase, hydrophobic membrane anchor protein [Rhodomicrobium sp.]